MVEYTVSAYSSVPKTGIGHYGGGHYGGGRYGGGHYGGGRYGGAFQLRVDATAEPPDTHNSQITMAATAKPKP